MKDIFVIENMIQLGNAEAKKKKKTKQKEYEVEEIKEKLKGTNEHSCSH